MANDWRKLIENGAKKRPEPITAETYIRKWSSFSKPCLLLCSDGAEYVVKGQNAGRAICTDQIAGRVGALINAPTPEISLVTVPPELIAATEDMKHVTPGSAHGSRLVKYCSERLDGIDHVDEGDNRARFASLAVFFGLLGGGDCQFIYRDENPHLVHSVDHGHLFTNSGDWSIPQLRAAPDPEPLNKIVDACVLTATDLTASLEALKSITPAKLAHIVACPPDEWGLSMDERVEVCRYIFTRKEHILNLY